MYAWLNPTPESELTNFFTQTSKPAHNPFHRSDLPINKVSKILEKNPLYLLLSFISQENHSPLDVN